MSDGGSRDADELFGESEDENVVEADTAASRRVDEDDPFGADSSEDESAAPAPVKSSSSKPLAKKAKKVG
jgi:hypothetical protein